MPRVALSSSDMVFHYQVASAADLATLDPRKETLLMLHPGLCDLHYFDAQFQDPRLRSRYNLVAFDARAHGGSIATPLPNVTLERKARCLLEAWDKLQFPPFHVYGESLCGCAVGIYLAFLRPMYVLSLLLVSPMHEKEDYSNLSVYEKAMSLMLENKNGNGDKSGAFSPAAIMAMQHMWQGEHTSDEQKSLWAKKVNERYGAGHAAEEIYELFNPLVHRTPISDAILEDVQCPVLILHGTEDCAVSLERVEALQQAFISVPGGGPQLHLIHGAPHFLSATFPSIVTRFILKFLDMQGTARKR